MKKNKRKLILITFLFALTLFTSQSTFARDLEPAIGGTPALPSENQSNGFSVRASQGKKLTVPGGILTSNTWRSSYERAVGNTYQWDYQVSAVYSGNRKVRRIRTSWYATASLRNSASMTLGISSSGVTVSKGSSWKHTKTPVKYWENYNKKISDYRSNVVVTPKKDYRVGTISVVNTALVELVGSKKIYTITSGS